MNKIKSTYSNMPKFIIQVIVLLIGAPLTGWCQQKALLLQRNFYRKQDSTWNLMTKEHYLYDMQGRLKSMVAFDTLDGQWLNHLKTEYTYSQIENESSRIEITSEGNGKAWGSPIRTTFILDQKGRDISSISEELDSSSSNWNLLNKGRFLYIGDQIYQKAYVKGDTMGWKNEDQTLYKYIDTLGATLLSQEAFFNWANNAWKVYQVTKYHYNSDRRISYTEVYGIDKLNDQIKTIPDTKHIFSYDTAGNFLERKIQRYINGVWEDKFLRKSIWDIQ